MAKILVIDDDETVRNLIKMILERQNHQIETACDGVEARSKMKNNPADLVITDLIMPNINGSEVIQEIRQNFPNTKIIAISGQTQISNENSQSSEYKFGADRIVGKPFPPDTLISAVNEVLENTKIII